MPITNSQYHDLEKSYTEINTLLDAYTIEYLNYINHTLSAKTSTVVLGLNTTIQGKITRMITQLNNLTTNLSVSDIAYKTGKITHLTQTLHDLENQVYSINNITSPIGTSTSSTSLAFLESQFDEKLIAYNAAYSNYITQLRSSPPSSRTFTTLTGKNYWGVNPSDIIQTTNSTTTACQATCNSSPTCTGSTFRSSNTTCYSVNGDGNLTNAVSPNENDVAIIPTLVASALNVKQLNDDLQLLIGQINTKLSTIDSNSPPEKEYKNSKQTLLTTQYESLQEEKNKINKELLEYDTITEGNVNKGIEITQEYFKYKLLLLLMIVIIILTVKQMFFGGEILTTTITAILIYLVYFFGMVYVSGIMFFVLLLAYLYTFNRVLWILTFICSFMLVFNVIR